MSVHVFFVNLNCYILQFPVIITRSNNVYGPHQYPEKVRNTTALEFDVSYNGINDAE